MTNIPQNPKKNRGNNIIKSTLYLKKYTNSGRVAMK